MQQSKVYFAYFLLPSQRETVNTRPPTRHCLTVADLSSVGQEELGQISGGHG